MGKLDNCEGWKCSQLDCLRCYPENHSKYKQVTSSELEVPMNNCTPSHLKFASHLQADQRMYQAYIARGLAIPKGLLGGESNYSSRGVSPIRKIVLAIAGFRQYQEAIMRAAQMIAAFALVFVSQREQKSAYLVHHKRLPGSLRTSRLRKKRRTRVECWYRKFKKRSKP